MHGSWPKRYKIQLIHDYEMRVFRAIPQIVRFGIEGGVGTPNNLEKVWEESLVPGGRVVFIQAWVGGGG